MASKFLLLSILIAPLCSLSSGQRLTEDCLEKAGYSFAYGGQGPKTPCSSKDVEIIRQSMLYLEKYGYLPKKTKKLQSLSYVQYMVMNFQTYAGLKITNNLDDQSLQKMQDPRCGEKEIQSFGNILYIGTWGKKDLTWSLKNFAQKTSMARERQLNAIRKAFRRWSLSSRFDFTQVIGRADIELSFEYSNHGDSITFDSSGKILGHAYLPPDGRVHFNNDVYWTEDSSNGINLEYVATHQIGHALGLPHVPNTDSIMAPIYPGYTPRFGLSYSDVLNIQRSQGGPKKFCTQFFQTVEAAVHRPDNNDLLFVDDGYVISGATGQKTLISSLFEGVKKVDAAVYLRERQIFLLIKDQKMWGFFKNFTKIKGYSKTLNSFTPPHASVSLLSIHALGREFILLIKNFKYWILYPDWVALKSKDGLDIKNIFPRIPKRVDAAFSDGNEEAYFLTGNVYASHTLYSTRIYGGDIDNNQALKCSKRNY